MATRRSVRRLIFASLAMVAFGCNTRSVPDTPEKNSAPSVQVKKSGPRVDEQALVTMTPKAAAVVAQIQRDVLKDGFAGTVFLRLRILPGGCTGFTHKLDLDAITSVSTDNICESEGIKIVVWRSQVEMLRGAKVDYGEKDGQTGFIVKNSNLEGVAAKNWLANLEASVPQNERPKPAAGPG